MFGIGKKLFKTAKKVNNLNLLEAIVAATMLVASSDGEIEKAEREKLDKLLTSNEQLSAFKPAEIRAIVQRYEKSMDADFLVGRQKMMKEIADISDNSEHSEEVFLNALAIANADGEIEDKEKVELIKIGRSLGIDLSEYGLV